MSAPQDPLDRLLDRWESTAPDAPGLENEVWRRIGRLGEAQARPGFLARLESRFARPAFAVLFLVACILGALLFVERRTAVRAGEVNAELARQYMRLIDPLRDAPGPAGSLDRELAWLRDELRLSPAQFARIREFHESSGPELRALALEVVRMRRQSEVLEAERRTGDPVDFLAVARLDEARRSVDRACLDSTQRLVREAATVMTPEQRSRYLQYIQAAPFPDSGSHTY